VINYPFAPEGAGNPCLDRKELSLL